MAASVAADRYQRLMAGAAARVKPQGYVERHHVVPRSMGGDDTASNLVWLTAREHFIAHWLLHRVYRTPATARAFKLMVQSQGRRRGRDYAQARAQMAQNMRGELNVARRPDVRQKLKANARNPFAGKKRPEHAQLMRAKGLIRGENNPFFGQGARQTGVLNLRAKALRGAHSAQGERVWGTLTDAAIELGVTVQAISQALRRGGRTQGWKMEAL